MESLWMLLPISLVLVTAAIFAFSWAVNHNQFEALDQHALDVLEEDREENTL